MHCKSVEQIVNLISSIVKWGDIFAQPRLAMFPIPNDGNAEAKNKNSQDNVPVCISN